MTTSREDEPIFDIVRCFYRSTEDIETGIHYKEFQFGFIPMTYREAKIIKSKLNCPKLAIDMIKEVNY